MTTQMSYKLFFKIENCVDLPGQGECKVVKVVTALLQSTLLMRMAMTMRGRTTLYQQNV